MLKNINSMLEKALSVLKYRGWSRMNHSFFLCVFMLLSSSGASSASNRARREDDYKVKDMVELLNTLAAKKPSSYWSLKMHQMFSVKKLHWVNIIPTFLAHMGKPPVLHGTADHAATT